MALACGLGLPMQCPQAAMGMWTPWLDRDDQAWETRNELKSLKIELTHKDNKIVSLENKVAHLQNLNTLLVSKIVSAPDGPVDQHFILKEKRT